MNQQAYFEQFTGDSVQTRRISHCAINGREMSYQAEAERDFAEFQQRHPDKHLTLEYSTFRGPLGEHWWHIIETVYELA